MSLYLSRRALLQSAGALALPALMGKRNRLTAAESPAVKNPWKAPRTLVNPNVLVVMVDQMRSPTSINLNPTQLVAWQNLLPNIFGRIQSNSYSFNGNHVAATVCTSSRASLYTGTYSQQNGIYQGNPGMTGGVPTLDPNFYTWATALPLVNPAYSPNNSFWFGKWHVSQTTGSNPLGPYGFNWMSPGLQGYATQDPEGTPNEGTVGGTFDSSYYANDAAIANASPRGSRGSPPR